MLAESLRNTGGIEVSRQPLSWIVSSSMTSVCLWFNSHVIFLRAKPIINERGGKMKSRVCPVLTLFSCVEFFFPERPSTLD